MIRFRQRGHQRRTRRARRVCVWGQVSSVVKVSRNQCAEVLGTTRCFSVSCFIGCKRACGVIHRFSGPSCRAEWRSAAFGGGVGRGVLLILAKRSGLVFNSWMVGLVLLQEAKSSGLKALLQSSYGAVVVFGSHDGMFRCCRSQPGSAVGARVGAQGGSFLSEGVDHACFAYPQAVPVFRPGVDARHVLGHLGQQLQFRVPVLHADLLRVHGGRQPAGGLHRDAGPVHPQQRLRQPALSGGCAGAT